MSERFVIKGGKKLEGEITVFNAKNAALKILAASLLTESDIKMVYPPNIEDILRMKELLGDLGVKIASKGSNLVISARNLHKSELKHEIASRFRASIILTAPILARLGKVTFPHPGGCTLGKRPIDFFTEGFQAMGAKVKQSGDNFTVRASKLKGAKIIFPKVSVTGTETMIMAAALAQGNTILKNVACEPEVVDLVQFLRQMGAKIQGEGSSTIKVEGVKSLNGAAWSGLPDRIEAGTFLILAAACGRNVRIKNFNPEHLEVLIYILDKVGVPLEISSDSVTVRQPRKLKPFNIVTKEYPGFATDLQAPFTVLMTQAQGTSLIHETIYDGRLFYTDILNQMGANIIMADPHRVIISGPTLLHGKKIFSPDIRAGIGLVIAALVARGETQIDNIYQIDRGYEKIDERLKALGADIVRVKN